MGSIQCVKRTEYSLCAKKDFFFKKNKRQMSSLKQNLFAFAFVSVLNSYHCSNYLLSIYNTKKDFIKTPTFDLLI